MSLETAVLVAAAVSTLIPVVAVIIRGRSRPAIVLTALAMAMTASFYLVTVLRLVRIGSGYGSGLWVRLLMASATPMLLAGYAFSAGFGRDSPESGFRRSRRILVLLAILGLALLASFRRPSFITGYDWIGGRGTVYLGYMGKAYLSYLLLGVVFAGYNFEKTYRIVSAEARYHIRLPLIGLMSLLGFFTFVLATGVLYAGIGTGKLIASALPIGLASVFVGYGYLRGAITDVEAPVSRHVVYSSFTALAAGLFVFAMGLAAQVAAWTGWSPDEILIVTFVFLLILVGALLLFSNRFHRHVRRYIDRNFYVNRYDYRAQWSNITQILGDADSREALLDRASSFLREVFAADDLTIALKGDADGCIGPLRGKGSKVPTESLDRESPLFQHLEGGRKTLLLDRKIDDFTFLPIYVENIHWLDATACQIVAPLMGDGHLAGTIGLERSDPTDPFTFEDVALLDSIAAHIGAALRAIELARELSESRERELISQWSSMLLHDLKNYLAPLRLAATNLVEGKDDPECAVICAGDVNRVADRMEKLVQKLGELRDHARLAEEMIDPNQVIRDALADLRIDGSSGIKLELALESGQLVRGDRDMLRRVIENLLTNAVEAMSQGGTLSISSRDYLSNGDSRVTIDVRDTGCGIPEDYLRTHLFRPFATTKKRGLGLGLYQCRSIVRAHGGELSVKSQVGVGTKFQINLVAQGARPWIRPEAASLDAGM